MRKNTNQEQIQGYIYQQSLQLKTVKDEKSPNYGKEFISGTLDVATDEKCLNVLTVHYTYVAEHTKSGSKNATYTALKKIYDNPKTVLVDGIEGATKVKLTPSAALNDFYPQGQDTVVSQPRNEGGFVTILNHFDVAEGINREKFTFDMLITHVKHIDADPEKNIAEDYVEIKGAIFNFKNDLLPFTVVAKSPGAMKYFEELNATEKNPVYTQVWGKIVSATTTIQKTVESAFGEDAVDITQRKIKEWIVTGAKKDTYVFDDPSTITTAELEKAIQDRNVLLASIKQRRDEYNKEKEKNNSTPSGVLEGFMNSPEENLTIPAGGFSF